MACQKLEEEFRSQNGLRPAALTGVSNQDALYETLRVACFFVRGAGTTGEGEEKALRYAIRQLYKKHSC